jgi:YD repeat-containing protein
VLANFNYDNANRRISIIRGNGTVQAYNYSAQSRLDRLVHTMGAVGTAYNVTFDLTYNQVGQIEPQGRILDCHIISGDAPPALQQSICALLRGKILFDFASPPTEAQWQTLPEIVF